MRRFVAVALALSLLSSGLSGCSQPIDSGSSVPAQAQPLVALLALVGLGIGIAAWDHHNAEHHNGGGSSTTVTAPVIAVTPFITGYAAADLTPNSAGNSGSGDLGVLELPAGSGTGKYAELFVTASSSAATSNSAGIETLPAGYEPQAVADDPSGNAWFVDRSGKVYQCSPLTTSTTSCGVLAGPLTDGLPSGPRSMSVDGNFLFVVEDAGGGKVDYAWLPDNPVGTTFTTGSYQSASTASIDGADAVESTPPASGGSGFTVFHEDGSSDIDTFNTSGSSVTVGATTSFTYRPVPDG
ncbi:MAG TPA: hypothetical protein VEJ20_03885, partial [Candidatus Eremiobacteraceae bacterium]|nr:hypothetical protein [Candidatus Eremiobacteraceae bacterium]